MFVRYCLARAKQYDEEFKRWNYIADVAHTILDNQTAYYRGGKFIKTSFMDYCRPPKSTPPVKGDDIVADLVKRGAMEVIG